MLAIIAVVLVVLWVCSFLVFKITGVLIHLLLLAGLVMLVLHLMKRRKAP